MTQKRKLPPRAKRAYAFSEMTPALQEAARQIEEDCRVTNRKQVLRAHAIGQQLEDIATDPISYGLYGTEQITKFFPGAEVTEQLRQMRKVAAVFSRDFVSKQSATPTPGGRLLEFGHFAALADIESEDVRLTILHLIRTKDLTVAQTYRLIADMAG